MQSLIHLLFIFLLSCPVLVLGQQVPLYTQYRNQLSALNPAGLSIEDIREGFNIYQGLSYQNQFLEVEERPSNFLGYRNRIWDKASIKTGFYIAKDEAGAISHDEVHLNFAYLLRGRYYTLSAGLSAGLIQKRIRYSEINNYSGSREDVRGIYGDLSTGISFIYDEQYYINIYVPHTTPEFVFKSLSRNPEFSPLNSERHFVVTLGGYFDARVGGDTDFWEPSFLLAFVKGAPFKVDFNFRRKLGVLWFGAGVANLIPANSRTLNIEVGFNLGEDRKVKIGFAFDGLLGKITSDLGKSIDLNIHYSFEK